MQKQIERFFQKVDIGIENSCWPWLSGKNPDGYGIFALTHDIQIRAHRFSYEFFHNTQIPVAMFIDHICRNRSCVRPDHLRLVTPKQNTLENSLSITSVHAAKTHCLRGHPFSGENLYILPNGSRRVCRICRREYVRDYRREYMRAYRKRSL